MNCYRHPKMGSVAACASCGKDICAICASEVDEKTVCRDCAETMRQQPPAAHSEREPAKDAPASDPEAPATTTPVPTAMAVLTSAPKSSAHTKANGAGGERKKESLLSATLSLILPGAGQGYNGQVKKGAILAFIYLLTFAAAVTAIVGLSMKLRAVGCCCLPAFTVPLAALVYAIYDAYETAEKVNEGETVKDWL